MFAPLLKSCFPYYVSTPETHHSIQCQRTINDSKLSVANGCATSRDYYNGDRNCVSMEYDVVNCGSSGRRYSPPCVPPPPTPYANLFNVTEIEYAVPSIQRYQIGNGTSNMVLYENGRRITDFAGTAFASFNTVHQSGYMLQVKKKEKLFLFCLFSLRSQSNNI